jgi:glycosyltransferase involved in cell wall biosynthesis
MRGNRGCVVASRVPRVPCHDSMTTPPRVLVLADDCNPRWPSLPVVGYQTVRALADHADVTLVTHVRNRADLVTAGVGKARVEYVDNEYVAAPLFKLSQLLRGGQSVGWTTNVALSYPTYLAFEFEVWRRFRQALEARQFDIVHRVTPMSPTLPSPLAQHSPVPFVLGPLNGGLPWPEAFSAERAREKEWLVHLRSAYRWLPYHRSTFERSAAILVAFAHTARDLPPSCQHRALSFPEVGVDPTLFSARSSHGPRGRLRFLFVGRLVPYKLPEVAVECFERSPLLREHELVIAGSGPEQAALEARIQAAGLQNCVRLVGWKSQAEVGALMRESDVFVFPSIRELGAGVLVEAMATGLCSVAVDYGGPGELLTSSRGVKVPLGTREQITSRFVQELEGLARDPARITELGLAAQRYVLSELTWDVKAQRIVEVYRWVLGQTTTAPRRYSAAPPTLVVDQAS